MENQHLIIEDDQEGFLLFPETEISSEPSELTLGTSNSAGSSVSEENSPQLLNSLEFESIDDDLPGLTSVRSVQQENHIREELRPNLNMNFYHINNICDECPALSTGIVVF